MNIHIHTIFLILLCFFIQSIGYGQNKDKTQVQLAHENPWEEALFRFSKSGQFQGRVFYVKKPEEGDEEYHWFVQILDKNQSPVNFAEVELDAYRKGKKSIKLAYMAPVFPLCADGKYIIGFIDPNQQGVWKLDLAINHYGTTDELSLEMKMEGYR
ncbi:MAG: hypothetical protein AAF694_07450 [Bacteroidota bacterium]